MTRCRKIEPIIVRSPEGWLIEQSCGTCGRGLEKTSTGWRHIDAPAKAVTR